MFKQGDLLESVITSNRYCIYNCAEESCIIYDGIKVLLEGYLFLLNPSYWKLAYRPEDEVPDALYVPGFNIEESDVIKSYKNYLSNIHYTLEGDCLRVTQKCCCNIVSLIQAGCLCGGK